MTQGQVQISETHSIDPFKKAKRAEARKLKDLEKTAADRQLADKKASEKKYGVKSVEEAEYFEAQLAQNSLHSHEVKAPSRYIPAAENHEVFIKSRDQGCAFVSGITGERCGSHFQLQRDHVIPYSRGGSNRSENLGVYCAQHNRLRWCTRSTPCRKSETEPCSHPVCGTS